VKWWRWVTALCLLSATQIAAAFYSWDEQQSRGDARLLLRGFGLASQKPANLYQSQKRNETSLGGLARIIAESGYQNNWHVEFNAYQTYMSNSLVTEQGNLGTVLDVERSGALEWSLSDKEYAHLAIDRLNARWSIDNFNIKIGRQAINLASTFFFTPNDFFAPFAAQAFYRVYKPGVDAVRNEISINELSNLSLIAVQGYQPQSNSDAGWSDEPESSRHSYLMRYVTNMADFEWSLLTGKVRRTRIQGGSISGELFGWLGIRAEGHQLKELDNNHSYFSKYSLGLEHRWENSLMLQVEQYYHGPGATEVTAYDFSQTYPARRYQALGLSYEFSPLLSGQFSILRNQIDSSRLYTMNAVYSLTNESELSVSLSVPDGRQPEGTKFNSEFGAYPKIFNIEIRAYF